MAHVRCQHKKSCTWAKGNRQIPVSKRFIQQRAASLNCEPSTEEEAGNYFRNLLIFMKRIGINVQE